MKSETFTLRDISNILVIPPTTIRDRIRIMKIKPVEVRKHHNTKRYHYSKIQLDAIKSWFEINGHKKQPKPIRWLDSWYCLKSQCIIVESKINL
jgi:hypothetical protein